MREQRLLAVDAPDGRLPAPLGQLRLLGIVPVEDLLDIPDRTLLRAARIGLPDPRRIGDHRAELAPQDLLRVGDVDGVVVGLAHLPAVRSGNLRGRRQHDVRLREDRAVEVVEASRDLARDLQVRALVLAHRDLRRFVQQDVTRHQDRVPEERIRRQVLVLDVQDLLFVRRTPLEPSERRNHRQRQMDLRVLRDVRLKEDRALLRIEPHGEPVEQHLPAVVAEFAHVAVVGHHGVPVHDAVETLIGAVVLEFDPVGQRTRHVSQMELARRPHAAEDTVFHDSNPFMSIDGTQYAFAKIASRALSCPVRKQRPRLSSARGKQRGVAPVSSLMRFSSSTLPAK